MVRIVSWWRSPRRVLASLLVVSAVPTTGLVWLGWRQIEQDQELAARQLEARLDTALDVIVSDLRAAIEAPAGLLDTPLDTEEALAVSMGSDGVRGQAGAPLLFWPVAPETAPAVVDWTKAERDEDRPGGLAEAMRAYRELAASPDPAVRAGALVRLGRALQRGARPTDALPVYDELARVDASVYDEPAGLLAGLARVRLLARLGRDDERATAASSVRDALARGQWAVDRATFLANWSQVAGEDPAANRAMAVHLAMAEAVSTLWQEWRARRDPAWHGSRLTWSTNGSSVTLAWRARGDEVAIFAATPAYFEARTRTLRAHHGVRVGLVDNSGRTVVNDDLAEPIVNRSTADTGLPWDVRLASATPTEDLASLTAGRRNLIWVIALATTLAVMGAYFLARGVRRELAVSQLQSDFVAAVSHEFRTPLTSMSHLIEILRDRPALDPARRLRYYDALEQEAGRLRRFVDSLLDFGRIDARTSPYVFETLDAHSFVAEVVARFTGDNADRRRDVRLDHTSSRALVRVDRDAMALAIGNLLDNSAKYSAAGTGIHIVISADANRVRVSVRDEGVGIPATERRLIFDKFVRGASAHSSGVRGTGVGLALVRQVVTDHGGDVSVESEPGRGSTFTITLPLAEAVPTPAARLA